jgi:hypothetical protein
MITLLASNCCPGNSAEDVERDVTNSWLLLYARVVPENDWAIVQPDGLAVAKAWQRPCQSGRS